MRESNRFADRRRDFSGLTFLSRLLTHDQGNRVSICNRIFDGDDRVIHGVCRKSLGIILNAFFKVAEEPHVRLDLVAVGAGRRRSVQLNDKRLIFYCIVTDGKRRLRRKVGKQEASSNNKRAEENQKD